MPDRGSIAKTLTFGESYTIPEGYHNGGGKITAPSRPSTSVNNFTVYPSVPNTYDKSSIIGTLMIPLKFTKLVVSAYQWNANGGTVSWAVNVRIRRAGTNTWDILDGSTLSIGGNSGMTYSKTFTSFLNYMYDAISFDAPDPKRLSGSNYSVSGNC